MPSPPRPAADPALWPIDPDLTYLNHGSFGACPRAVLDDQTAWRERMERDAVTFFARDLPARIDETREAIAAFVGADPGGMALVRNATAGVNAVVRSLRLEPGDELLTTDHAYPACKNTLEYVCARSGARVVVAPLPFPDTTPNAVLEAIGSAVSDRTRLALIDHITSQTGLVLPAAAITAQLRERGVEVLIDGAHGPGMVPLDLAQIGATYYTANCHKWLCAPKGSGFLWVAPERRDAIHPVSISHGYRFRWEGRSRLHAQFDWTGTDDPSPWLSTPFALRYVGGLIEGGWPAIMARNRTLALEARAILCAALGIAAPCPESFIGALASVPLPDGPCDPPATPLYLDPLQRDLLGEERIQVPIIPWPAPPGRLLRISAQLYNHRGEYEHLATALTRLLPPG